MIEVRTILRGFRLSYTFERIGGVSREVCCEVNVEDKTVNLSATGDLGLEEGKQVEEMLHLGRQLAAGEVVLVPVPQLAALVPVPGGF